MQEKVAILLMVASWILEREERHSEVVDEKWFTAKEPIGLNRLLS
jgi:hypothetical protein